MPKITYFCTLIICFFSLRVFSNDLIQPGFDQVKLGDVAGRTRAWGLGIGDFNEDNVSDIISGDTYGDVHVYLGQGDGTFLYQSVVINNAYHNA